MATLAGMDTPSSSAVAGNDARIADTGSESRASSERTRVRRMPARAIYDRGRVEAILDQGMVAHLAFVVDGQPYAVPTLHARVGDTLYVHGSAASRAVRALSTGIPACVTVTLLDGLVLARSAFHHSVNYRSAMVLGQARPVEAEQERLRALKQFTERLVPGRWAEVRPPTSRELKGVAVLSMSLQECSAKARSGPPLDEPQDMALPVWAGVVPLTTVAGSPQADPQLQAGLECSEVVRGWAERRGWRRGIICM
jgi:nitroimidazol reductase NimA-like FMN-containing flavoprotein (pyridoxamine 5'-phosphate oxidase superfamily)